MKKEKVLRLIINLKPHPKEHMKEIEKLFFDYLKKYPQDTEIWLRLAYLELTPPWEDPYRMQKYLQSILAYDNYNILATLFLAYIEYLFFGAITKEVLHKLSNLKTDSLELLSMIEYAKACNYEDIDKNKYKEHLVKSIEIYDKHVRNYERLGNLYIRQGKNNEGKKMLQKALNNIQHIYSETYNNDDITDYNEFFNYYYKGIHTTDLNKKDLIKQIKKL